MHANRRRARISGSGRRVDEGWPGAPTLRLPIVDFAITGNNVGRGTRDSDIGNGELEPGRSIAGSRCRECESAGST